LFFFLAAREELKMPDLIAYGPEQRFQWRKTLPAGPVSLGRDPARSTWAAPWDKQVSGLHAELTWRDGRLFIKRLNSGRNPIYYQGQDQHFDEFSITEGESFVIGSSVFLLVPSEMSMSMEFTPQIEMTCSREELKQFRYIDADHRIEVLAALPELIRCSSLSDEDLETRVVDVLLQGIPRASAAAVVQLTPAAEGGFAVAVRAEKNRGPHIPPIRPSKRLVTDAIHSRRQTVSYRWAGKDTPAQPAEITIQDRLDWVVCVPLPDDPSPGWGLYLTGHTSSAIGSTQQELLRSDLKFAELVGDLFGSLRQVRDLQRRHGLLTRFLSRPVLTELSRGEGDIENVLKPREAAVSVLFCDLRGSCLFSEQGSDDLQHLWDRLGAALGVMTSNITDLDGVIGDFQGDAAMGFWGWPLACKDDREGAERAARAALGIRRDLARAVLPGVCAGFTCGIGIASGMAYAGKLGTYDQFKVSVFGPVVNLAARLESMTKYFGVPILLDENTATQLNTPQAGRWCRTRRLARVKPFGMTTILTVNELLPPEVEPGTLKEHLRRDYEAALDAFIAGRWVDTERLLRHMPVSDGPTAVLHDYMAENANLPPRDWKGVIEMKSK
jgi:adenylate cyclase